MIIKLKLFATLCRHVPGAVAGIPFELELAEGATVADLIEKLGLPEGEIKIAFVNGRSQSPDWVLRHGDEAGIFPPVGGG